MKKFFSLLVVCVMVLSSVAVFAQEKVELRMAWWGSQNRHDRTIKVIELFQQKYPNITITYEPSSWDDHWAKLSTQAAGGNLPDIIQQDYQKLQEWVNNKQLLALDDFAKDGTLNFADVAESMLVSGKIDGKLYGINLGTNSLGWILDVDAFKKAGIPLPPQDWTWDEFEATMTQLKEKLGIFGSDGIYHFEIWKTVYLGLGQWVYAPDGKALGFTDDQPFIDHLARNLRMQKAGVIPTREADIASTAAGIEGNNLVTGKAASMFGWSNYLVAVWTAAGANRNLVMTHVPRSKKDAPANYIKPSMFFSVAASSKHPKEAAMFIDFFTNSIEANKALMAERGVPISTAVMKGLEADLTPAQKVMFEYLGRVATDGCPLPPVDPAKHTELMNNVYWPELIDPVMMEAISVEDGVKTFRKLANDLLAQ